jgi:hypothetical protein
MGKWKSEKQMGNEKKELIKELRKQNDKMLEMLKQISISLSKTNIHTSLINRDKIEQLIKEATEL